MTEQDTQALVVRQPQAPLSGYVPPPDKSEFESMIAMANTLAKAQGFLPAHFFGQPYKILAAILYGRDLGISATNALQHIIVIEGKATADAQLIGMLVRRAGHQMVDTTTDTASTVKITRSDGTVHEATFTMQDAQRAGLVRAGGAWTKYPAAMLYARALTAVARKGAQDALMGTIYTPEELGAEVDGNGAAILPASAPTGEIPTDQATPESVAVLQEAASSDLRQEPGLSSPQPAIQGPAAAVTSPLPSTRSVGPRAKRQNVVQAPQGAQGERSTAAVVTSEQAGSHVASSETGDGGQKAVVAVTPAPPVALLDEGDDREAYLAELRQQARSVAALVVHLRILLSNKKNAQAIALGTAAAQALTPLMPHAEADQSLATFIATKFPGQALDSLSETDLGSVISTLEEIVERIHRSGTHE